MKIKYAVFWLKYDTNQANDNYYFILGEWMSSFETKELAVEYTESLKLRKGNNCTILEIYTGI